MINPIYISYYIFHIIIHNYIKIKIMIGAKINDALR